MSAANNNTTNQAGLGHPQQQQQQHQQQQQPMAIIKRSQHNNKLASILNNMLQCGSLVDVTIYCDDGQVNAHKLVLAASSAYFRNLFSRMTNAFHFPIIVLREMPVNDLKTIIQFIYHGEVNVPQNRVDSLMRCANYLQIDGMASSANSINAVLASSSASTAASMSHLPLLGGGPILGPALTSNPAAVSSINNLTCSVPPTSNHKLQSHSQYPLQGTATTNSTHTTSKGRGRGGGNHHNSNHSNSNNNNSGDNNHPNSKSKHTCPLCMKTFTHGFTLKRHMKLHSERRHTIFCEVCAKSYSCKDSYLRHKKSSGHLQHVDLRHRPIEMNIGTDR